MSPELIEGTLLWAFIGTTFLETVNPGPTFALVLQTRMRRSSAASASVVAGITIANLVLVVAALLLGSAARAFETHAVVPVAKALSGGILMFMISRGVVSSVVGLLTDRVPQPTTDNSRSQAGYFLSGLFGHGINPLTFSYYFGAFSAASFDRDFRIAIILGAIAILFDLVFYTFIAVVPLGRFGAVFKDRTFAKIAPLATSIALLFFVTQAFDKGDPKDPQLAISAPVAEAMFVAFSLGALVEATDLVRGRREQSNRLLWNICGLWSSAFGAFALAGAIHTLILALSPESYDLRTSVQSQIRITIAVASILAVALSYAKSLGQLQDVEHPQETTDETLPTWAASPLKSFLLSGAFLVGIFLLLVLAGFTLHQ